jgi:hypothetical protein
MTEGEVDGLPLFGLLGMPSLLGVLDYHKERSFTEASLQRGFFMATPRFILESMQKDI